MKPFNLEAAKRGAPIVTRAGRPVKFLGCILGSERNVIVQLECVDGLTAFHESGRCYYRKGMEGNESENDLMHPTREVKAWVLMRKDAHLQRNQAVEAWVYFVPPAAGEGYAAHPFTFED